ncbi:bacterial bifunctional deaminase-reductase [Ascodesmis nigricans]|uniref:2,5-diamino-6-ribosylamino-4(3H)-pyrimidinone 5'-phosphate reductase n=1 Tax=Ascodesmis nigricans TaxID=341454 RepID=A0A4S2N7E3_9PEZI|nr:bacterial bifunctional deaminase-reductase [Ascodesmis nigricans]
MAPTTNDDAGPPPPKKARSENNSPANAADSSTTSSLEPSFGLPFITLTYATSLDSQLSLAPGTQTHLSGPLSKSLTHHLRTRHSGILIGVSTAVADDPGLNSRLAGTDLAKQPTPIVLDPTFRWNLRRNSRVLQTAREGKGKAPMVVVGSDAYKIGDPRIQWVVEAGGQVVVLDLDADDGKRWSWEYLLRSLKSYELDSIMIEGGGEVINSLLKEENQKYVGAMIVTVAPTYLGKGGVRVCPDRREDEEGKVVSAVSFSDVQWLPLGRDVVMAAKVDW